MWHSIICLIPELNLRYEARVMFDTLGGFVMVVHPQSGSPTVIECDRDDGGTMLLTKIFEAGSVGQIAKAVAS